MATPSYCSKMITDMDAVPPQAEMIMYQPYFQIIEGQGGFTVFMLVPNDGYNISSGANGAPASGSCATNSEHEYTITYNDNGTGTPGEVVLQCTVPHGADPDGELIIVYTENEGNGTVKATKSRTKVGSI